MNYANIKYLDVANGIGLRTSLFVSGCKNNCPFCFNKIAQDFNYGKEYTQDVEKEILDSIEYSHVKGLSILGGDPMELENQETVLGLIKSFRERFGTTKDIWVWTGYIFDKDLVNGGRRFIENITDNILQNIDYIVDGPFINDLKNLNLKYRGSSNQRVIDVRKSLENNEVIIAYK
jgi:anaerobic ribonucleoside-triphosphate reductase activating protein